MQYNKMPDGTFEILKQQNVDTGMGLERVAAILQGVPSHYETELFKPIIDKIRKLAKDGGVDTDYWESPINSKDPIVPSLRIIADHIRAATFIMGDPWGVAPSNKDQGYILRRLIRRSIRQAKMIGIQGNFTDILGQIVIDLYGDVYPEIKARNAQIIDEFKREEAKFQKTIEQGLREMKKIWNEDSCKKENKVENGNDAFFVYETYGFPIEMIAEELEKMGYKIDSNKFKLSFEEAHKAHQAKSRSGSEMKFAGGLADHSWECTMLHTATHLLNQALRNVLGNEIEQKGSNITAERLRFDFNYKEKMTPEQLKQVEEIVNTQIQRDLPVSFEIITVDEAKAKGAIGVFSDRYDEKVKVYSMGDFSREICGGPHVPNTGALKKFKILKEEAVSAGIRRIKAVVVGAGLKE
jgi:alanyl-tRNA synthetase